ncbi:hypothetical protein B0T25DRAFT_154834 [Lasiosphaeria hispida]|uniref:Uncharacterized protein n=1 Tax=Lasiosphaeria hispida TaxID=260671 RepID=A0AAJ0MGC3_9PEZI|nr:hypothetical protein B0T25DRAFT_154834 [Lasiosphaeria hispida]
MAVWWLRVLVTTHTHTQNPEIGEEGGATGHGRATSFRVRPRVRTRGVWSVQQHMAANLGQNIGLFGSLLYVQVDVLAGQVFKPLASRDENWVLSSYSPRWRYKMSLSPLGARGAVTVCFLIS